MCKFIMFVKGGRKKRKRCKRHLKGDFRNAHSQQPEGKMCLNEAESTHYKDKMSFVEWSSAARCSRMSPHQHRSITSTSCWWRKMQRSSGRWSSSGRLNTLCMWVTQTWLPPSQYSQAVFLWSTREPLPHRCQTRSIDHLALVDPVQVESFGVHLHGNWGDLWGVLGGHTGVGAHVQVGNVWQYWLTQISRQFFKLRFLLTSDHLENRSPLTM